MEILDDIGAAVSSGKSSKDFDSLLSGVEMIYKKAIKIFEEAGVKPMDDPAGKEFDVDFHEALMSAPSEETPEGSVLQTIQKGYMYRDKVLRHAKVIASAGSQK